MGPAPFVACARRPGVGLAELATALAAEFRPVDRVGVDQELSALQEALHGVDRLNVAEQLSGLVDLMMPRLDGYEVTRGIRGDPTIADMPVVLLTARSQDADVARGFDVGADDYIRKPFSPQELLSRVQAILGRR